MESNKELHEEKELFKEVMEITAQKMGVHPKIVEKDYFITMFLEKLVEKNPDFLFKGGTSLSKCYNIISRFSEDIDLNVISKNKPSERERRTLKNQVFDTASELGFNVVNKDDILTRGVFNCYSIDYPTLYDNVSFLNKSLKVEIAVFMRAYPYGIKEAESYIYRYLYENGYESIIDEYGLHKFQINVQSIERTFVDKCFAICDYYLENKIGEHSRHIYDIFKLSNHVSFDDGLKALIRQVRGDRSKDKHCLSADPKVKIPDLLGKICQTRVYEEDYDSVTSKMLFNGESVSYSEAIKSIEKIITSGLFE